MLVRVWWTTKNVAVGPHSTCGPQVCHLWYMRVLVWSDGASRLMWTFLPLFEPSVFSGNNLYVFIGRRVAFVLNVEMNSWVLAWGAGSPVLLCLYSNRLVSLMYSEVSTVPSSLHCTAWTAWVSVVWYLVQKHKH